MVAIQEDFEDPHIFDEDDLGNDDEIIDIYKHSYWYICELTVKWEEDTLDYNYCKF